MLWLILLGMGEAKGQPWGKFEPPRGCYLGAFVERDHHVWGDFVRFERLLGRKHASYFTYVGYGEPFPTAWVERVKAAGAVPHIAWEPNRGLQEVHNNNYLWEWAYAARRASCPLFLRFASEMNGRWTAYHGNPPLYVQKWRLVARVMQQVAPNVAMVWAPFSFPLRHVERYYPGDDVVDWVGINIYAVHHHNGDPRQPADHEDPCRLLEPFYRVYASRKPIMIAEFAATHFCQACRRNTLEFALEKMRRLYTSLPTRFPRVKMVNWFCWDTILGGKAENNYSLLDDERKRLAYLELTASDYFLKEMPWELAQPYMPKEQQASEGPWLSFAALEEGLPLAAEALSPLPAPSLPKISPLPLVPSLEGLPADGQVREAWVRLRFLPEEDEEVKMVSFRIDGSLRLLSNRPPYEFLWNAGREAPGLHRIEVLVYPRQGEPRSLGPIPVWVEAREP